MRSESFSQPALVLTIGHSNRTLDEFLHLLQSHGVTMLADVRTIPGSRSNPQFNQDTLQRTLEQAGIAYQHMPKLGGLRRRRPDSPNTGWENASFQGYADYMLTPEFDGGLQDLLKQAEDQRVALMCAEAVPWRCHRSLIADALIVHGIPVHHIFGLSRTRPHTLHNWAHVEGKRITYPPQASATDKPAHEKATPHRGNGT